MTEQHPYWLIAISTGLALSPVLIGLFTSFVKVHVVLSFFRSGLGAQQVPSGLIIMGIALALSLSIMSPTITEFQKEVSAFPWQKVKQSPEKLTSAEVEPLLRPWRTFLEKHAGERELRVFEQISQLKEGDETQENMEEKSSEVIAHPWSALLPAFVVTELKEAFLIGFVILLPFLAIDLIVANVLAGVGMFMVSPVVISLPLKVALFTFADGWLLLTKGLAESYFLVGG